MTAALEQPEWLDWLVAGTIEVFLIEQVGLGQLEAERILTQLEPQL